MATKRFDEIDRKIALNVAKGKSYAEIGGDVGLSPKGVQYRVDAMTSSLGVRCRQALLVALVRSDFFAEHEIREICGEVEITIR